MDLSVELLGPYKIQREGKGAIFFTMIDPGMMWSKVKQYKYKTVMKISN